METDLNKLIAEKFPDMDVIVCANLPYYITSPVIMKLLEEKLPGLVRAGLDGVNISLDTLDRELFRRITGFDRLGDS